MIYRSGKPISKASTKCSQNQLHQVSLSPGTKAQGYNSIFGGSRSGNMRYIFPVQDTASAAVMGRLPLGLDTDSLYDDHNRWKRKYDIEEAVAPNVQVGD
jgi:hypothetical protein